jgi:peptidoglycan/LPS O-acetylase OafA/YrhL
VTAHSHKYRKDIDGLRGIAVLFVLGFHCSRGFLGGGFLGVDVFFVISGYLISSIIFNDVLNDRFSIARFYERRIKRIFPSLIAVLSGTLILGWFVLWASEYRNLGKHVMGGATFVSNLLLWGETGYFDARAEFKPLLHLWSLGVEEQFYIFFPLCVWLAVRIRPAMTTFLLRAVFVVSFGLCSLGALTHPGAAFYLPVTRLWELSVGCILASVQEEYRGLLSGSLVLGCFGRAEASRPHPVLSNLASFLGLAMIVGGGVFLGA